MLATLPGVQAAVRAQQAKVKANATSLFAAHNRPAGHKITTGRGTVDAYVYLEGPAATSVEFGHARSGAYAPKYGPQQWVKGLFIMSRAAR